MMLLRLRCTWTVLLLTFASVALAHWPGQPEHQIAELGDLKLESGEVISNFRMSYVTHGKLNAAKSNAILAQHGFAANHHLYDHLIGPGQPLDTDKYFIICPDALGATQTGYEHTTSPTNSGLRMKFPAYTARDMVNAQYRLITEALAIPHLLAITGISSAARDTVQFAISYPGFMDGIVPIVGAFILGSQGRILVPLAVSIVESCKEWEDGNYDINPKRCATVAISQWVYLFYTREWWYQYADTPEAYRKWRTTFGEYYLDVQDARDLYYRMRATGRIADTPGFGGDLNKAAASIGAKSLFIYNPRDELYLPGEIEAQIKLVPGARSLAIDSNAGHMMCCNADPNATRIMGDAIRKFLDELVAKRYNER